MTTYGFHVAPRSKIQDIQELGIIADTSGSEWKQRRQEFREALDTRLKETYNNPVKRKDSVFFWSTIPDADEYIRTAFQYQSDYAIVTVNLTEYDVWMTDNQLIEQLFELWVDKNTNTLSEEKLTEFIETSTKWNGESRKRMELWCQSPIDPNHIEDIS